MKVVRFAGAAALALAMGLVAPRASAQSAAEIQAARDLFVAAMKDEQASHYDEALKKFQHVREVKDTPQVQYRIAVCLAGLGKLHDAKAAFSAIQARPDNREEKDVEAAAKEQAKALAARTPDLTVRLRGDAPGDVGLTIDGARATAAEPHEVDPGEHVVVLAGAGVKRTEARISVAEGTHQSLELVVELDAATLPRSGPTEPRKDEKDEKDEKPSAAPPSRRRTYGIIGMGAGGALAIGSVVTLILHNGDVDTIKKDCPGNVCPTSTRSAVTSARSDASTMAVTSGVLAGCAVVAAGVGAYLFFVPGKAEHVAVGLEPGLGFGLLKMKGTF